MDGYVPYQSVAKVWHWFVTGVFTGYKPVPHFFNELLRRSTAVQPPFTPGGGDESMSCFWGEGIHTA